MKSYGSGSKLILTTFLAAGVVSCGGGGGSSGSNSNDGNGDLIAGCEANEGYYTDSGFTNGVRLKPGQMPSDIDTGGITACQEGGFVYNGKCWNTLVYDVDNYKLTASSSNNSVVLFDIGQNFDSERNNQVQNITNGSKSCDFSSTSSGSCSVYEDYRYPATAYNSSSYFPTPSQYFGWRKEGSLLRYDNEEESLSEFIYLRTDFGSCGSEDERDKYKNSLYRWYYDGSIIVKGQTFSNPMTLGNLREVYGNDLKVEQPFYNYCGFYGGCFSYTDTVSGVKTTFGIEGGLNATDESKLNLIILPPY